MELIKFTVSNTSCYAAVENGALLHNVARHTVMENNTWRSWKTHGKFSGKSWEPCASVQTVVFMCETLVFCKAVAV